MPTDSIASDAARADAALGAKRMHHGPRGRTWTSSRDYPGLQIGSDRIGGCAIGGKDNRGEKEQDSTP
jgi:hypothetical protein